MTYSYDIGAVEVRVEGTSDEVLATAKIDGKNYAFLGTEAEARRWARELNTERAVS